MTPPPDSGDVLFDSAPAAFVVTDHEGRIRTANPRFLSWLGDRLDARSTTMREHLTASSCLYYESVVAPVVALEGEVSDVALALSGADRERHTMWALKRTDVDLIWVGIDVTNRRLQERELVAVQRRLERLRRLSSDLLGAGTAEAIGEALLRQLVDGVKADRGALAIEAIGGRLETVAVQSMAAPLPELRLDTEPLVLDSLRRTSPRFATVEARTRGSFETGETTQVAVLPLVHERAVGVVWLELRRALPYSTEEQELLIAASDIASSALGRAMLHRRLERDARRNEGLSRLLHAMEAETTVQDRARTITELLVPEHGELALVRLDELAPEPAGLRHVDRSKEPALRWLYRRMLERSKGVRPVPPGGARMAPTPIDLTTPALVEAGLADDEIEVLRSLELGWGLRVPLVARGRRIGTLLLGGPERLPPEESDFHGRLADACALSLDNARLYEHEREVAHQLQDALLPDALPIDRRFSLHHFYQSARDAVQVGGDWYDAFLLGADRLGIMIGDVVGGGVSAARGMGNLRTVARAFAGEGRGVAGTLAGLHRYAAGAGEAFASSMMYGEVDLVTGTMEHSSAGHPPAVLVDPGAEPALLAGGRGELLGLRPQGLHPETATEVIPPGTTIVMYTDGLIERPTRSLDQSLAELVNVLRQDPNLAVRPDALARRLVGSDRRDDTCVLALRMSGPGALAPDPGSV